MSETQGPAGGDGAGATPPPGGTPPPPGGTPPPPPPPGGTAPPPAPPTGRPAGAGGGLDIGAAVRFGWERFQQNAAPIVIGLLVLFVVVAVVGLVWQVLVDAVFSTDTGTGFVVGLLVSAIGGFVFSIGGYVLQGMMVRAGFDLVDGHGVETKRLLDTTDVVPIVVTGLLVAVGTLVGTILCYVPGLVFAVLASFAMPFVVDQGREPMDAVRASIDLFRSNLGDALVLTIVTGLIAVAGFLLCGVGALVSVPVALIAMAHGFRQLTGGALPAA